MRNERDITRAVRTHADTVLRICALYFHGRPEQDDAFQETFLKYAQSDKEFEGDEHLKAWLVHVAANTCKDMLKRHDAKTVLIGEFDETAEPSWSPTATESSSSADLLEALRHLSDTHRITLYLKYYEGYTAAEIAETLDMPENTVYANLARGRNKLKEVLARESQR